MNSPHAFLTIGLALWAAASLSAQEAVTNGDFSSNAAAFTTPPGYVGAPNPDDLDDWVKSTTGLGINGVGISNPFGPADKSAATYYAFIQNGGKNISQVVPLTAATAYDLSFLAGNRSSNPNALGSVVVQDNSSVYYDSGVTNWGTAAFQLVDASLVTPATIDGAVTITLFNNSGAGDNTVCYSNVSLIPNTTPPTISSLSPADGAPSAPNGADLVITFDEFVVKGSGDIVIRQSSDDVAFDTIDVNSANVTVNGAVVTINPASDLARGVGYYVEIAGTAFDDLSGNDFAGITGNSTWNFTTTLVNFVPISGDADSGISTGKTYTHAIDFGNDATAALLNGVQFQTGKPAFGPIAGTSATIGTGTLNLPSSHPGNAGANPYLVDGAMEDLVRDMAFNANNAVITLTGLTPGVEYQFRLYNRQWGPGDRGQDIGFDTDGIGTDITGAEALAAFEEDNATSPDPSFPTATQVNALSYVYTLAPGVSTLTIYINKKNAGSYHLYGLTNEVAQPPAFLVLSPADDGVDASLTGDLAITFDELVEKGTGNIVIRRFDDDSAVETIDVTSGNVTVNDIEVTISPTVTLANNTSYYVEIDAGAFVDLSGNSFAGISGNATWKFATTVVNYVPISGDADSGISSSKTYTHAIDFGADTPAALINGVQFQSGMPNFGPIAGTSATIGTGTTSVPATHGGNTAAAAFLVDGGMEALVEDMTYNDDTAVITLTGLTPGIEYQFRLYNRQWAAGNRGQVIGFDTDGIGSDITGAEATSVFEEDNASAPDPGFPTATQVNALSYAYTLAPGVTTLTVYINKTDTGTYHLYGLTNEVAQPPGILVLSPADDAVDVGLAEDLVITFDENIRKGSGTIVIRQTSDGAIVKTIDVTSGDVTVNGTVATINPAGNLSNGTSFYVEIDAGAFQDLAGNGFPGIAGNTTWNFSTTDITFVAISGDADSGIDSARSYTHALDFGDNGARPTATINGVVFANGGTGAFPAIGASSQTVGTGSSNIPNSHPGNDVAAPFLVDGGMEDLVGDMIFGSDNGQIELTGLTAGQAYQIKLYHRPWQIGFSREQSVGFNTDGFAGAESSAIFNEDDASDPDPSFATSTQVYALTYDYVLPAGVTTLTINIDRIGTGSYHLYGLTNEALSPYGTWAAGFGLTGPDADPAGDIENGGAGDGLENLLEFAFGTNPHSTDNAFLEVTSGTTFTPGTPRAEVAFSPLNVTYRFVRRVTHATDGLVYTPQFTSDGSTFQDSTATPTVVVPDDGTGYEVVEVPFMLFLPDGMKAQSALARVQVTLTP